MALGQPLHRKMTVHSASYQIGLNCAASTIPSYISPSEQLLSYLLSYPNNFHQYISISTYNKHHQRIHTMQFKALLLTSLAACVLAESTSSMDMSMTMDSSMSMETRASTDGTMSRSSDDRSMMDHSSTDDRSSMDHSSTMDHSSSTEDHTSSKDHSSDHSKTAVAASATSDSHSSSHTSDHSSSTASGSSGSASRSSGMAMATTIPMIGAAAMAGIAFAL